MNDHDSFFRMAQQQGVNTHDSVAYRAFLKQASQNNDYARNLYRRELGADQNVAQSERQTQDLYIKANDHAASTVDMVGDLVTLGAHHNLQDAFENGAHGDSWGAIKELGKAGAKIAVATAMWAPGKTLAALRGAKLPLPRWPGTTFRTGTGLPAVKLPATGLPSWSSGSWSARAATQTAERAGAASQTAGRVGAATQTVERAGQAVGRGLSEETRIVTTTTTQNLGKSIPRGRLNGLGQPLEQEARVFQQATPRPASAARVAETVRPPASPQALSASHPALAQVGKTRAVASAFKTEAAATAARTEALAKPASSAVAEGYHHITTLERQVAKFTGIGKDFTQENLNMEKLRKLALR